jgi:hypothetical protein
LGDKSAWGQRHRFRCENDTKREKHRTEATEVTEGEIWVGGKSAWGQRHRFRCENDTKREMHRTEATEVTEGDLGWGAKALKLRRKKMPMRTDPGPRARESKHSAFLPLLSAAKRSLESSAPPKLRFFPCPPCEAFPFRVILAPRPTMSPTEVSPHQLQYPLRDLRDLRAMLSPLA